jgi:hypothetical protein
MAAEKKMAKVSRFVQPQVVRLELSDGDWLEIRRELTVGEQRAAMARTVKSMRADGRIEPDLEAVGKSEIAAYIIDWSFVDANDKRVPYSWAALDNLTADAYAEIETAVRGHISALEADRGKAKSGSSLKSV